MPRQEAVQIASAVITQPDSAAVLLMHRYADRGEWELPGGEVRADETAEETAKRGLRESLGVEGVIGRLLTKMAFERSDTVYECRVFQADGLSGTPVIHEGGAYDELRYVDLGRNGVGQLGLAPSVEKLVWLVQNDEVELQHSIMKP